MLREETFICVGPGRWGTSTPDLGVGIAYGDIYHTRALVELTGRGVSPDLEPSFGTHFFQDLMEAHIFPLNVNLDDGDAAFNRGFFEETRNRLGEFMEADETLRRALRVIKVEDWRKGGSISLVMNDELGRAIAYVTGTSTTTLAPSPKMRGTSKQGLTGTCRVVEATDGG
jgi:hypothetical protein